MRKRFDCVEMKHRVQAEIYEQTQNLSREDEVAYFHRHAEQFWRDIDNLRKQRKARALSQ